MRVRFGECVLDSDTRELFRGEKLVHLPQKAFRLLELLLESRPRALSKQELHSKVWPGTSVSEATLAGAVSDIRALIGDDGSDPGFIRTVHGFGYAFSGSAVDATGPATPVGASGFLVWEDRVIPLVVGDNLLGRGEEVAVRISDASVSRHHARIVIHPRLATLEDLDSKNGSFIGGSRITRPASLSDGDEIRLGDVLLTFRFVSSADSTKTVEHRKPLRRRDVLSAKGQEKKAQEKKRSRS